MRVKNRKILLVSKHFNAGVPVEVSQDIQIPFHVDDMIVRQALYDDANDNSYFFVTCDLTRDPVITLIKDAEIVTLTNLDIRHQIDREVKTVVKFSGSVGTAPVITTNAATLSLLLEFVQYEVEAKPIQTPESSRIKVN